jgi:folate-binding protein YgfZ
MSFLARLPERGVVAIAGDDRVAFLQGLVSNDVAAVAPDRCVWTALLSPQGKWLADFFIFADRDRLLLDCERSQAAMLMQRLSRYRLRMKVSLAAEPDMQVYVAWGGATELAGLAAPDPRLPGFATRILSDAPLPTSATEADWDLYRLQAGLPEGSRDLEADRTVLLEAGFDELNGVSWSKGCYMGQELTARTKYRGLVKRRLVPVTVDGPVPDAGTPVLRDGVEVGTIRSAREGIGLAVLRLDALSATLRCGEAMLTPRIPGWMRLPDMAPARRTAAETA